METNPLVPRQRNRRAARQVADVPAEVQPAQPMAMAQPVAQAQPVYQQMPVQQMPPVQPAVPVQQAYQQAPHTMYHSSYQQPTMPASQPVLPAAGYPPMQGGYQQMAPVPQNRPAPMQSVQPMHSQQPSPTTSAQYAARPGPVNQGGWQQPLVRPAAEVPHARASSSLNREIARDARATRREADAKARKAAQERAALEIEKANLEAEKARRSGKKAEAQPRKKLPGWLTTALSLSIIGVMALVAAYYMMQAYLVTQENARIAAYEAVLNNYHVTESADGTLRVTWQDHIEKYAAQYNLQPAFVTAIIRNESSFRTNAESTVGARGLMQLMPDTAEWIAGKLDDYSFTFDKMWDAETNIRYGCWYLGYLSRLFHGDAELVSAAYHAGQTTVTQWLSDPGKSSDGVTLNVAALADGPTKQYIGRVTQTYGIYQSLLYPDQAFSAPEPVSTGSRFGITIER